MTQYYEAPAILAPISRVSRTLTSSAWGLLHITENTIISIGRNAYGSNFPIPTPYFFRVA